MLSGAASSLAQQQSSEFDEAATRRRPEYAAVGINLGGFTLYPRFTVEERYDDNILADDAVKVDDLVTELRPAFQLRSNWSVHAIELSAEGHIGRHADRNSENYEDARARAVGRFDFSSRSNLTLSADFRREHETRGDPNDVFGVEPTRSDTVFANVALFHAVNRLQFKLSGTVGDQNYHDSLGSAGVLNNDDRDRATLDGSLQTGYEFLDSWVAFVRVSGNRRNYDLAADDFGFNRDSKGYDIVGGAEFDLSHVTYGAIYGGYFRQAYDDLRLAPASGETYGLSLTWNPTPLTTVRGGVERQVRETTISNSSGIVQTSFRIGVFHELLRNVHIQGDFGYVRESYEGVARREDLIVGSLAIDYLLSRSFHAALGYDFTDRSGDKAQVLRPNAFSRNRIYLRLLGQM